MSLLSVVNDVCRVVGVHEMTSVINNTRDPRTAAEMLSLANEMSRRIAYDTREWTRLYANSTITGDGVTTAFPLPADFKRMVLTANVRRSDMPTLPLRFIADIDEWVSRRARGYFSTPGEWIISAGTIDIIPALPGPNPDPAAFPLWVNSKPYVINDRIREPGGTLWKCLVNHTSPATGTFADALAAAPTFWTMVAVTPAVTAHFVYLDKNCIGLSSAPPPAATDEFMNDDDYFLLDERLLKLGMIWQWKAQKGSPYAEDMASYETALARLAGSDRPAPIIIDRLPISQTARVAFPWPSTWP